jgi:hypothetical protein
MGERQGGDEFGVHGVAVDAIPAVLLPAADGGRVEVDAEDAKADPLEPGGDRRAEAAEAEDDGVVAALDTSSTPCSAGVSLRSNGESSGSSQA